MLKRLPGILILVFVLFTEGWALSRESAEVNVLPVKHQTDSAKVFTIQVAASKVFIQPDSIAKRYRLDQVSYFKKDGWFKYVTGSFSTEEEANRVLAAKKIKGFVTTIDINWLLADNKKLLQPNSTSGSGIPVLENDSASPAEIIDNVTPVEFLEMSDTIGRYTSLIQSADSAFNFSRNLEVARRLYAEAANLIPDRQYPSDQIVEIDKLLVQRQKNGFLSSLTLKNPYVIGLLSLFVITVFILLVVWYIRRKRRNRPTAAQTASAEPELDFLYDDVRIEQRRRLDLVRRLFPYLERILNQMDAFGDPESAYQRICEVLNSEDEILRMEAILAVMLLDPDKPYHFLDLMVQEFTPWAQLQVLEMARRNRIPSPDFRQWLTSANPSIVEFCKKMIGDSNSQDRSSMEIGTVQDACDSLLHQRIR